MILVQVQQFGAITKYGREILHKCSKRVETASHKVLRATFVEIAGESLKVGPFCPHPE